MSVSGQQDDMTGKASGSPLDDPPELNLELPEEAQEGPDELAADEPAATQPQETIPEDDPEALPGDELAQTDAAPTLAERDLPGLEGRDLGAGAMESELSAISSLDEVVANELENRLEGNLAGLDVGDSAEEPEAAAEDTATGYKGLNSDMIDAPGEGVDLMTVLASIVMGDPVPVDLAVMGDPKKWRYDENPLKQLAERDRPDITPDQKQDRFRTNARTMVAAGAAVLALMAERHAQAQVSAENAPVQKTPQAKAPGVATSSVGAGTETARPVPAQEQAPAPMNDDTARLRRQEELTIQQARLDEQRRMDAQQFAERDRRQRLEAQLRDNPAAAIAAGQDRDFMNRMIMLDMMNGPDAALANTVADPSLNPVAQVQPAGADGASSFDGFASLASLFRDNMFSVTAPGWSTPDTPGWQTALNAPQVDPQRQPLQAAPALAQTGPELLKMG